jgi:hypothetical protein
MKDGAGEMIEMSWFKIDNDEARTVTLCQQWKVTCWRNFKRRADNQHKIGMTRGFLSRLKLCIRKLLSEEDNVRLDYAAAGWAARDLPIFEELM